MKHQPEKDTTSAEVIPDARGRPPGATGSGTLHQVAVLTTVPPLGQAFRLAVKCGRLPFLPPVRHLSEVGNVRRGFLEHAEIEAVVNALPAYLRGFCRFGYHTGWRKGDISALRWADVDGEAVRLRGEDAKNRQGRSIPLQGELAEINKRRRAARHYTDKDKNPAVSL